MPEQSYTVYTIKNTTQEENTMTKTEERMLNKIKELKALEREIAELQEQADDIKAEIKLKLESNNLTEMQIDIFTIRYTPYSSQRFDTKTFKKDYSDLYEQYTKETQSRRFSIS